MPTGDPRLVAATALFLLTYPHLSRLIRPLVCFRSGKYTTEARQLQQQLPCSRQHQAVWRFEDREEDKRHPSRLLLHSAMDENNMSIDKKEDIRDASPESMDTTPEPEAGPVHHNPEHAEQPKRKGGRKPVCANPFAVLVYTPNYLSDLCHFRGAQATQPSSPGSLP